MPGDMAGEIASLAVPTAIRPAPWFAVRRACGSTASMRSGSSFSRYSASRSCACLSGPPVRRTADNGSGRATSGMAFLICCAFAVVTSTSDAN